jgi:hypothetical protein
VLPNIDVEMSSPSEPVPRKKNGRDSSRKRNLKTPTNTGRVGMQLRVVIDVSHRHGSFKGSNHAHLVPAVTEKS